jgi:hypothetical protein
MGEDLTMKAEVTMTIKAEGTLQEAYGLLETLSQLYASPPKPPQFGEYKVPGPTEEEIPF